MVLILVVELSAGKVGRLYLWLKITASMDKQEKQYGPGPSYQKLVQRVLSAYAVAECDVTICDLIYYVA